MSIALVHGSSTVPIDGLNWKLSIAALTKTGAVAEAVITALTGGVSIVAAAVAVTLTAARAASRSYHTPHSFHFVAYLCCS